MSSTKSDNSNQKNEGMSQGKTGQDSNKQQANQTEKYQGYDVKRDQQGPTASRGEDRKETDKNATGGRDSQRGDDKSGSQRTENKSDKQDSGNRR